MALAAVAMIAAAAAVFGAVLFATTTAFASDVGAAHHPRGPHGHPRGHRPPVVIVRPTPRPGWIIRPPTYVPPPRIPMSTPAPATATPSQPTETSFGGGWTLPKRVICSPRSQSVEDRWTYVDPRLGPEYLCRDLR